jgi:hypothetical protein
MDWFSAWEPLPAWVILAVIVLAAVAMWYRLRVVRHSFWCAAAGRDVEMRVGRGCVQSCSAFEAPTAIACARRCLDRSFRVQWPPAIPVLARPQGTARLA